MDTALHDRLIALFEPVLKEIGYELVEVEFVPGQGGGTLRIYIDHPEGIDVDDCGEASHALSELLDANDPFPGAYSLEVSSPGLDRPLRGEQDYRRFVGRLAKIVTNVPIEGQSAFAGRLAGFENGAVMLSEGRRIHRVPLGAIKRARLEVEF